MAGDGAGVVQPDHLSAELLTGRLHLQLPIRPLVPACLHPVTTFRMRAATGARAVDWYSVTQPQQDAATATEIQALEQFLERLAKRK